MSTPRSHPFKTLAPPSPTTDPPSRASTDRPSHGVRRGQSVHGGCTAGGWGGRARAGCRRENGCLQRTVFGWVLKRTSCYRGCTPPEMLPGMLLCAWKSHPTLPCGCRDISSPAPSSLSCPMLEAHQPCAQSGDRQPDTKSDPNDINIMPAWTRNSEKPRKNSRHFDRAFGRRKRAGIRAMKYSSLLKGGGRIRHQASPAGRRLTGSCGRIPPVGLVDPNTTIISASSLASVFFWWCSRKGIARCPPLWKI